MLVNLLFNCNVFARRANVEQYATFAIGMKMITTLLPVQHHELVIVVHILCCKLCWQQGFQHLVSFGFAYLLINNTEANRYTKMMRIYR